MSRRAFGGDVASFVVTIGAASAALIANRNAAVTMWNAATGGSQYTDLKAADGTTSITSVTAGADGLLPQFYGPDGVAQLWANAPGAAERVLLLPTDSSVAYVAPAAGKTVSTPTVLPFYNVKDFGAVGDGATDDTTAIQGALNAAAAATYGGTVWIPPGDFRVSAALTINASNVKVMGAGAQIASIVATSATADVFSLGSGAAIFGLAFQGFSISTTAAPKTAGAAFKCTNVNRSSFLDINLYKMFTGYQLVSGANVWIERGFWGDFTAATGTGLLVQGGNDQYVRGIVATCASAAKAANGINVQASGGSLVVADSDFICFTQGLHINPANAVTVNWLWFTNVAFDLSARGIYFNGAAGSLIYGIHFLGCWTSSSSADGVTIGGASTTDTVRFTGHRSFNNAGHGFSVLNGVNVSIVDSDISGNSLGSSGTNQGIYVAGGTTKLAIAHCRSKQMMAYANTQANGIFLDSGASDFISITDCDVTPNALATITNFATGTHNRLAGNNGYNPTGKLTAPAVPASTVALVNPFGVDCQVFVNGGTVTDLAIGGQSISRTTNVNIVIPAGQSIMITYTVAPTWTWFGN